MGCLIYMDMLRMVSPGSKLDSENFDYYVLGTFDAMKVDCESVNCLSEFLRVSRDRYTKIPYLFNKQPLCFYSKTDCADFFNPISDGHNSKPLVLTLVQLHDDILNSSSPEELITAFEDKINEIKSTDTSTFGDIVFHVFYSLGESDVGIAFRGKNTSCIAKLLYRLRCWEDVKDGKGIRILSICSHVAFPNGDNDNLSDRIQKWMEEGDSFITFVDSSYGANDNHTKDENGNIHVNLHNYLLGEYDYLDEWPEKAEARAEKYFNITQRMANGSDTSKTMPYRIAYTIPKTNLGDSTIYDKSEQTLSTIQLNNVKEDFKDYYEQGRNSVFDKLAELVKKDENSKKIWGDRSAVYLGDELHEMKRSLSGLLNHLIRLREGRFESDLYAFVVPVFKALPNLTKNCTAQISYCLDQYHIVLNSSIADDEQNKQLEPYSKRASELLQHYLEDCAYLIESVQHLFSVLSVSPNNYLETYGSTMRSTAATCKLLCAYHGIAHCISEHFPYKLKAAKDKGEDITLDTTFLILPYRVTRQITKPLFFDALPVGNISGGSIKRINTIKLDFAELLKVDRALFLLLHEIGHHVIPYEVAILRTAKDARKDSFLKDHLDCCTPDELLKYLGGKNFLPEGTDVLEKGDYLQFDPHDDPEGYAKKSENQTEKLLREQIFAQRVMDAILRLEQRQLKCKADDIVNNRPYYVEDYLNWVQHKRVPPFNIDRRDLSNNDTIKKALEGKNIADLLKGLNDWWQNYSSKNIEMNEIEKALAPFDEAWIEQNLPMNKSKDVIDDVKNKASTEKDKAIKQLLLETLSHELWMPDYATLDALLYLCFKGVFKYILTYNFDTVFDRLLADEEVREYYQKQYKDEIKDEITNRGVLSYGIHSTEPYIIKYGTEPFQVFHVHGILDPELIAKDGIHPIIFSGASYESYQQDHFNLGSLKIAEALRDSELLCVGFSGSDANFRSIVHTVDHMREGVASPNFRPGAWAWITQDLNGQVCKIYGLKDGKTEDELCKAYALAAEYAGMLKVYYDNKFGVKLLWAEGFGDMADRLRALA